MGFPTDPLDVVTELYVGGDWTDVTGDVLLRDRITITRGRADEGTQPDPSTCTMSLRNTNGTYSPRNPLSAYFGQLGRNTPLRVSVSRESDDFGRTVTDGWGSTAAGLAWTLFGASGTVQNSDWNVDGSVGTQSVPATNGYRAAALEDLSYRDVEVAVSVTLDQLPTGTGTVEPATIMLRGQSTSSYYMARMAIDSDGTVVLIGITPDGDSLDGVVVDGLTYTSVDQVLRVRAQIEGATIRMRAWDTSGSEPSTWHLTAPDSAAVMDAGWVGVRSGVATGITNTLPIVFSYDDLEIRLPRFAGEVSSWPARWDLSGHDVWVPITAAGVTRRLGQGAAALKSPLRRELTSSTQRAVTAAYWPCEDGEDATQIASASAAAPMRLVAADVTMASSTAIPGSTALPKLSSSGTLTGDVTPADDGAVYYRQVAAFPAAGTVTNNAIVARILTTGTARRWDLVYATTGALSLHAYDASGTQLHATSAIGFAVDAERVEIDVDLVQDGSDVDTTMTVSAISADGTEVSPLQWPETFSAMTVGHSTRVIIGPGGGLTDTVVGHIGVGTTDLFGSEMSSALIGRAEETAGDRVLRLAGEENVPVTLTGAAIDTAEMGAQRLDTLLNLLRACADADGGVLHEARSDLGVVYRARSGAYNQTVTLALDYTADGEVAPPLTPVDDDQHVRNDVTVARVDGSQARHTLDTGALSTLAPPDGVGTYDEQVTLNLAHDSQLADQAAWKVHLGTWDEARYPTVHVDLAAGPTLIPAAAAVDVRDRITISNPPDWLPPGDVDLLVEGYTETLGVYDWDLVYNCSPAGPWTVGVLDDKVLGRADTAGSELTSAITKTATSISISTTSGPVWISGSSSPDFPFDVICGGEVMTVTAISGTTSPQTATVTRGTNSLALAHAAGTALSLATPMRLAL